MAKRTAYFQAGCQLVWQVDCAARRVSAFRSPRFARVYRQNDTLDGGDVLPGFTLPVATLFANLPPVKKKR
jgi:hypothetical protein